ncbi:MAG: hypothetical protein JWO92_1568 [Chitinophagaceae bacterium]|nr:hypothetical protein [Chitinophagaceae bacterium]
MEKLLYEERIKHLETELQKATETLTEYKKQQEEFILMASHDLQAPLRKLSTFVERLIFKFKEASGEEAKSYIDRIQLTVKSMRAMIDSLAALSNITEAEDDFQKCDLNDLLQKNLDDIRVIVPENNAEITWSSLPVIEGNCTQLKHLFLNLISNSIKFQKKDTSLQIKINSEKINEEEKKILGLSADKIYHKIEIADNGIGFEEQYSEKIFQPFQRLHGKSDYEGNGLGLAICKKIMEKHHGIIYAKGSKDSGARFILILPETSN